MERGGGDERDEREGRTARSLRREPGCECQSRPCSAVLLMRVERRSLRPCRLGLTATARLTLCSWAGASFSRLAGSSTLASCHAQEGRELSEELPAPLCSAEGLRRDEEDARLNVERVRRRACETLARRRLALLHRVRKPRSKLSTMLVSLSGRKRGTGTAVFFQLGGSLLRGCGRTTDPGREGEREERDLWYARTREAEEPGDEAGCERERRERRGRRAAAQMCAVIVSGLTPS